MLKPVEQKLEEANKLIFVKRYGEAELVLDEVLAGPDGRRELLDQSAHFPVSDNGKILRHDFFPGGLQVEPAPVPGRL